MIKNVKWFFVVLIVGSLSSLSFREKSTPTEKLPLGVKAPELVFRNEAQPLNLRPTVPNGYTLLSFWASYDAVSRVSNATLSHAVQADARIKMISVSFDRYRSVFEAAIRQDGIATSDCRLETEGEDSEIFRTYDLESGFRNYLVDSKGIIVAKNLTASELAAYLNPKG